MAEEQFIDPHAPRLQYWPLPRWLMKSKVVSLHAMNVYSVLMGTTYDRPFSTVSTQYISDALALDERTIRRLLQELVNAGLIKRVAGTNTWNTWRTFFLLHPDMPERDVATIAATEVGEDEGGGGQNRPPVEDKNDLQWRTKVASQKSTIQPEDREKKGLKRVKGSPISLSVISSSSISPPPPVGGGVKLLPIVKKDGSDRSDRAEREVMNIYIGHYFKRYGTEPILDFAGGKALAIARRILAKVDLFHFVRISERYFASDDPFIVKHGHPFSFIVADAIMARFCDAAAKPTEPKGQTLQINGHGRLG